MGIEIRPATTERFDDLALLVGPRRPDANVCWCLSHRLDSRTNRSLTGTERRDRMAELCAGPVAPGVLAYDGDEVVGWAAVAPRAELPIASSRKIPVVDDQPVWSVICLRVRPGRRGRGITRPLLTGAVRYAAEQGAPAVEGYPVDNQGAKVDLTMAFVGVRAVFEQVGFRAVAETSAVAGGFPRVLMRHDLDPVPTP